jgi:hypothetical protein
MLTTRSEVILDLMSDPDRPELLASLSHLGGSVLALHAPGCALAQPSSFTGDFVLAGCSACLTTGLAPSVSQWAASALTLLRDAQGELEDLERDTRSLARVRFYRHPAWDRNWGFRLDRGSSAPWTEYSASSKSVDDGLSPRVDAYESERLTLHAELTEALARRTGSLVASVLSQPPFTAPAAAPEVVMWVETGSADFPGSAPELVLRSVPMARRTNESGDHVLVTATSDEAARITASISGSSSWRRRDPVPPPRVSDYDERWELPPVVDSLDLAVDMLSNDEAMPPSDALEALARLVL